MEFLGDQFEDAVSNVSISGEKRQRAIAAHTEVRELLETDSGLKEWGIDTILIGSYARETGRYPGEGCRRLPPLQGTVDVVQSDDDL